MVDRRKSMAGLMGYVAARLPCGHSIQSGPGRTAVADATAPRPRLRWHHKASGEGQVTARPTWLPPARGTVLRDAVCHDVDVTDDMSFDVGSTYAVLMTS